jgi:hypothetical protein
MDKALDLEGGLGIDPPRLGWIRSPAFDLSFFLLPALAGFTLAWVAIEFTGALPAVAFAGAYLLGIPHYLASFAFFCGDENREHARRSWALFYVMPVLICAAVAASYLLAAAALVHAVLFVWNIYHVASQSSGVS